MKSPLSLAVGTLTALSLGIAAHAQHYNQTNLVGSSPGIAPVTDPLLVDDWGLARASNKSWWANDNDTGVSTLYNGAGAKNPLVVTIPPVDPQKSTKGSPTGIISSGSTTDFLIGSGQAAQFVFATHDGGIAAWNPNVAISQGASAPSTNAVLVVKNTDGSAYTGLTSGVINGKTFLYAANFTKERIDIFDSAFHRVDLSENSDNQFGFDDLRNIRQNQPFIDNELPAHYSPFNVQAIGPNIVVAFGLHVDGQNIAQGGPGLGFVDIFSSSGQLLTRLEHNDNENAPWGITLAPLDFGLFSHDLLIGQFGGGVIAAYDIATGKFEGLLQDPSGKPIVIPGVWALSPGNITPDNLDPAGSPAAEVYFSARNNGKGLFGRLTAVSAELVEGSAQ
ncbi:MAG TPA: TIGR03118 family protein [Acidobacteriaceae bacterium]